MNMKPFFILLLIFSLGWGLSADKIGYINPTLVLQNSIKGKEVIARLEATRNANQKRLDALQREVDALGKEMLSQTLSSGAMDKKTLELQAKRTALSRATEDARNELAQKRQKEFDALQKEIFPIIAKIASDEGYTMVFDVTTTGIAYANPAADITAKVVQAFDAKYQAAPKTK